MRGPATGAALVVCLTAAVVAHGQDAPSLPIGVTGRGSARREAPASYWFEAPSAGLLTAAVQAEGDVDLVLFVCDADGQPLPDLAGDSGQPFPGGRSDKDLLGSRGVEALTLLAPAAGRYVVVVEVAGAAQVRFTISGAFAPLPGLVRPDDPDGRPSGATALSVDGQAKQLEGVLTPREHDLRDWFALRCERAGTLGVVLRASDGDLRLDAFNPGSLRTALLSSDDDEQGVPGNESLSVAAVQPGQVVLVRVSAVFSNADRITYRLVTAITD